ncbi:MAG: thiazole synthase [Betaproteobacteria bacterium]|nr:MAG: thiazole synthase [Betaproteobacteria bacterium]
MKDALVVAGRRYGSRLLVGTGKYRDFAETRAAVEASGAEIVTVAIRRTNIGQNPGEPSLLEALPPSKYTYLPNTAGCYDAADAVRTLRLARELLDGHDLVKLEVLGDPHTLYPNMPETLKAAQQLVKEGFKVMVYCSDDPVQAQMLEAAGCYNAADAVRTLRLARELLDGHDLVKLEVLGDPHTLYPNMPETLKAAQQLVKEGFKVMVYCSDDPVQAQMLEAAGCVAVMPLASLIGSGMGILNPWNLQLVIDKVKLPVLVDAGVGTASDAAIAMELGCDGVLMNTAIAAAKDPVLMAKAMKKAVEAGREAFLAGRMPKKLYSAAPSSPVEGTIPSSQPKAA